MEPVSLGVLAAALLMKAVEKVGEDAGDAGAGAVTRFAGWLRQRAGGHAESNTALERFEEAPDSPSRARTLAEALDRYAQQEPAFDRELRQQVEQAQGAGVDVALIAQTAWGGQNVQVANNHGTVRVSHGHGHNGPGER